MIIVKQQITKISYLDEEFVARWCDRHGYLYNEFIEDLQYGEIADIEYLATHTDEVIEDYKVTID
jgi:hypothetical protein